MLGALEAPMGPVGGKGGGGGGSFNFAAISVALARANWAVPGFAPVAST